MSVRNFKRIFGSADAAPQYSTTPVHTFCWFAILLLASLVYGFRLHLFEFPPIFSAAYNQLLGLNAEKIVNAGFTFSGIQNISDHNPPLYYLQEAWVFHLIGANSPYTALLANLVGLLLLSYCTYRIAASLLKPVQSLLAGGLVLFLPMTVYSSQETLTDTTLAGWVACSLLLLLKTDRLQRKWFSLLLGASAAAGMLVAWTYPLLMILPVLLFLFRSPDRRRALENCLDASFVALLGTLWWYLPNAQNLFGFAASSQVKSIFQKRPVLEITSGWVENPQALFCWIITLGITLIVVWILVRRCRAGLGLLSFPVQLIICWLAGILIVELLPISLYPHYMMQAAAPLSILLVYLLGQSRRTTLFLIFAGIFFLIFALVPFPVAVYSISGSHNDGLPYGAVLSKIPDGAMVGFLNNRPRFHAAGLQLTALRTDRRLNAYHVTCASGSTEYVSFMSHIVGIPEIQKSNCRKNIYLDAVKVMTADGWTASRFTLADGNIAEIWTNPVPFSIDADQLENWQGEIDYLLLGAKLGKILKTILPGEAVALVVCKGDDEWASLLGSNFRHFPQSEDGSYAGYNPANGTDAVAHLNKLASRGAQYIVFPKTSLWWLDYYLELKNHLYTRAEIILKDEDLAFVYKLSANQKAVK